MFALQKRTEQLFLRLFRLCGEMVFLLLEALLEIRFIFRDFSRVLKLMAEVGFRTLPLASMIGLFTGMILALQTGVELEKLSLQRYIGGVVGLSMVREMGPMLVALIVAGRVGAAMAAELGTMKVSEEIDALRSLGINPVRYLVMPRLFASLTMQPLLTMLAVVIGIWGGALIASTNLAVNLDIYYRHLYIAVEQADISIGLFKAVTFGGLYSLICCYMGLTATGGAEGVGKATTRAVVISLTMILVADFFIDRFIA